MAPPVPARFLVLGYASIVRDVDGGQLLVVVEPDDRDLAHVSQTDGVVYAAAR